MSTPKIIAGYAYRQEQSSKKLANGHHKNARGGYRDHVTTPVPKNEGKQYSVDRTIKPSTALGPSNQGRPTNPRDDTRKNSNVQDTVKQNESSTIGTNKNLLIIGGVVGLGVLVYWYYR